MKTARKLLAFALVLSMAALAGCGSSPASSGSAASTPEQSDSLNVSNKIFSVGSGPSGSLYINYTAAWSDLMMRQISGLNMIVEPGGSTQNPMAITAGDMEFGIASSLQVYPGYYGIGWADGEKYDQVRNLFPCYSVEGLFFTIEGSPINSIYDLEGKLISLGYAGGGSDTVGRELLDYFGITPKEYVGGSWTDVGGMLKDGLIDAVFYLAGNPASFIQELEINTELKYIPIGDDNLKQFVQANPAYAIGVLPANTYKHQTSDYASVQGWNFIMCSIDLPEDLIYEMTKTTWENIDDIHRAHSSFVQTQLENVKYSVIPLHPGAERYYTEIGVELPDYPPAP